MNQQNFAAMREVMVASQLRTVAVNDARVVEAFRAVPRELFVPPARAALAYADMAVPLGEGGAQGRSINPPLATARLISAAEVQKSDHVLLVGAALGYAAAVLAKLAASVVAVEENAQLCEAAKAQLKRVMAVTLVHGALAEGAPNTAPYDVIMIDGSVEYVPDGLIDQLKIGGRLVTGIMEKGLTRLALGQKTAGGFGMTPFFDGACVPLPGFAKPKVFTF